MKPSDFKVGDRVLVSGTVPGTKMTYAAARFGRILDGRSNNWRVEVEPCPEHNETDFWWFENDNLTHSPPLLSPQSPQPQTTQQKEDTVKPYAVIYQNLVGTTPSTITGQFTTEAEAKEYAEQTVAGQRANLTTKQYFAVTIVNTKTGKLVGSVVDAPPAVDWAS